MYDMYPEWGPARHRPRTPAATRPCSSRLTCETTAASAPTTTNVPSRSPTPTPAPSSSPSSPATASARRSPPRPSRSSRRGPRRGGSSRPATTSAPGASRPARCCPTRCSRRSASTTRSCSVPWGASPVTPTCPGIWSAGCCCGCASSSTTTSTCGRPASSRARLTPGEPRRWTSWSCARAPRAVHRQRRLDPGGHPPRGGHRVLQHGVRRRARRPRRLRPGAAPAASQAHPGPQDQRVVRQGRVWSRLVAEVGPGFPGRRGRLPAHRPGRSS